MIFTVCLTNHCMSRDFRSWFINTTDSIIFIQKLRFLFFGSNSCEYGSQAEPAACQSCILLTWVDTVAGLGCFGMLGLIDAPPPDTRTRGCTATGSRVGQDRASTAPSGTSRAGRRPERPEPPSAAATSYLQERHRK